MKPSRFEQPPEDEAMLRSLAPADQQELNLDTGHQEITADQPSHEEAIFELVGQDSSKTVAEHQRRRELLRPQNKALLQQCRDLFHEIGRVSLHQKGDQGFVDLAQQARKVWDILSQDFLAYQNGKIDEEDLGLRMSAAKTGLTEVRDGLLP